MKALSRVLFICPRLGQTGNELLDLTRRELVHIEMPQRMVYALCKGTVIADRALAELLSGIFVEPLLGKGFEFDMPGADAAAALFLKENHLPLQLFLNLPL